MSKMEFPAGTAPADAAHAFAKDLHARWGVGDAACNNGVLLLLSIQDRQVYVSTGAGGLCGGQEARLELQPRWPCRTSRCAGWWAGRQCKRARRLHGSPSSSPPPALSICNPAG